MGKLVVLEVFIDAKLMMDLAKRYDPIAQLVKNYASDMLFVVIALVIREVFMLSINEALLEKINLENLQALYDAQAIYLRSRPLWENFSPIGGICLVTFATPKPLLKNYFNPRAKALYLSLCRIFGVEENEVIPSSFVFTMAQIL